MEKIAVALLALAVIVGITFLPEQPSNSNGIFDHDLSLKPFECKDGFDSRGLFKVTFYDLYHVKNIGESGRCKIVFYSEKGKRLLTLGPKTIKPNDTVKFKIEDSRLESKGHSFIIKIFSYQEDEWVETDSMTLKIGKD